MNILALDIATHTGWACSIDGQRFSGTWDCSRGPRESRGMVFFRFRSELAALLQGSEAVFDLCVREQAHQRGGAATEIALGLSGVLEEFLARLATPCAITTVHSATLKKWTTGSGRADKDAMIAAANKRWASLYPSGPTVSDDEADARAMLEYAIEQYQVTIRRMPGATT